VSVHHSRYEIVYSTDHQAEEVVARGESAESAALLYESLVVRSFSGERARLHLVAVSAGAGEVRFSPSDFDRAREAGMPFVAFVLSRLVG
jgi:hypothetical protein